MEKDYLYKNVVDNFEGFFHKDGWLTVYDDLENSKEIDRGGIYCAFINTAQALSNSLSSHNWDLMIGHNGPTIIESFDKGKKRTKYYSRGHKNIDHFVIHRSEFGYHDDYLEIAEEFRLYYNLYEQRRNDEVDYIYIDSNGDENIIVKIEKNNRVLVKYNALIDFISTKKVHFVILFDFMLFSQKSMNELGLQETNDTKKSDSFMYNLLIRDARGFGSDMAKTQSWLMGKYVIKPKKKYIKLVFFSLSTLIKISMLISYMTLMLMETQYHLLAMKIN